MRRLLENLRESKLRTLPKKSERLSEAKSELKKQ
jgi:hypothetical protein